MEDYLPTNLNDNMAGHPMIKDFAMPKVTIKDREESNDTTSLEFRMLWAPNL